VALAFSHALHQKRLTGANPIEIIVENQLPIGLTTMKFLLFIAFAAGLLILERPIICGETFTEGVRVSPETVTLKPGEYVWEPERAPEGPLLIVASVTEQVAYVYRNGIRIARSSVSTGRPGHRTPTGVFTILEKEVHHTSSIYKGAEMPYMERVTWAGLRCTQAICRGIQTRTAASDSRWNFPNCSSASP
jgi:hypothetical protein